MLGYCHLPRSVGANGARDADDGGAPHRVKLQTRAYIAKARESLASAESELSARRFSSSGSRAYYAAFQAAVALLIENGIKPRGNSWEHKHVLSEFSGKLIRRRKVVPSKFKGTLSALLELRIVADYKVRPLSRREAAEMRREAGALVTHAVEQLGD
ncbi:MAG TPA: HEPN domain-containing protein [Dehalococcoidia bacterium]|nr:HEPN domain-containing protein [Dehalococcoidia bacterium]